MSARVALETAAPARRAWCEGGGERGAVAVAAGDRVGWVSVVLVEPTPFRPKFDPLACLSQATVVRQCRCVAPTEPTNIEQLYRRLDRQDDNVWPVDLDHIVCPYLPIFDPIVDYQVTKFDVAHFTTSFVRTLAPPIDGYFKQTGILSR